jgi:hypothetical protein
VLCIVYNRQDLDNFLFMNLGAFPVDSFDHPFMLYRLDFGTLLYWVPFLD